MFFFGGEPLEAVFPAILDERIIPKILCDRPDKKCNELIDPQDSHMTYLPTFTLKINQMKVKMPYMDPMGKNYLTDVPA